MKISTMRILEQLAERYPALRGEKEAVLRAFETMQKTYERGGKVMTCGNGGSAADAEHIVGELMKKFKKNRPIDGGMYEALEEYGAEGEKLRETLEGSLRAVSLTSHIALSTAFANDREPSVAFAQQLYGLADEGDTLIAISTSGNSENCVLAAVAAKAKGVFVVALTGEKGSRLSAIADVTIRVPEVETYKVQELHLPVYHCLCAMIEEENF